MPINAPRLQPPPVTRRPVRDRSHRRWRRTVLALVAGAIAIPVAGTAVLWPLTPFSDAEKRITARLAMHQARDGLVLSVPNRVGVALIATEDNRFYSHYGLDAVGVSRALWTTIPGSRQGVGGATLDQQLAKNRYTSGTALAKIEQIGLSFKLEAGYSRRQILEMYLSEVYFGHGFYGLPAAAQGNFGLTPAVLFWAQASMLAGLPQAPSAYDPYRHRDIAKKRQRHVLDRLVATGTLTVRTADATYAALLGLL